MGYLFIILLSLALCVDAFTLAVGLGIAQRRVNWSGWRFSAMVGLSHLVMIVLGYFTLELFVEYIEGWVEYLPAVIFSLLGVKMIVDGCRKRKRGEEVECSLSLRRSVVLSLSVSVDAFMAGGALCATTIGLSGVQYLWQEVLVVGVIVGVMSFAFTALGFVVGGVVGRMIGREVVVAAGVVLVALALKIFVDIT